MPHQCTECSRVFADGSKQMLAGCPDCGGNKFQFRPKGSVSVSEEPTPEPETTDQPRQTKPEKTRTTTLREWARQKVTPGSSAADGGTTTSSSATATQGTPSASTSRKQSASNGAASTASTASTKLDSFAGKSDERPDDQGNANSTDRDPAEVDSTDVDESNATADGSDDPQEDAAQADARSGVVGENELPDPPATDEEDRRPEDHEPRPDLAQLREELNDQFESIKVVEPGQYELNLMELYDRQEYIIALQENGRYVIDVPDAWDSTE